MSGDLHIRMLIVDDEPAVCMLCKRIGESLGFSCMEAESAEAALTLLQTDAPDIVLSDVRLPQLSGVGLLERIKAVRPRIEVAIMTGHGSIASAVEAMKLGAYDYVTKPFAVEEMQLMLQRMAEKVRLVTERDLLRERVQELQGRIVHSRGSIGNNSVAASGVSPTLDLQQSPAVSDAVASQVPTDLEHLERITIQRVFDQVQGDKTLAGKMLGISRATLYRKLKRYNIGPRASAAAAGNS